MKPVVTKKLIEERVQVALEQPTPRLIAISLFQDLDSFGFVPEKGRFTILVTLEVSAGVGQEEFRRTVQEFPFYRDLPEE